MLIVLYVKYVLCQYLNYLYNLNNLIRKRV